MRTVSLALLASVTLISGCNNPLSLKCVDSSDGNGEGSRALYVRDLENGYFKSKAGICHTLKDLKEFQRNNDLIVCNKKGENCQYGLSAK